MHTSTVYSGSDPTVVQRGPPNLDRTYWVANT